MKKKDTVQEAKVIEYLKRCRRGGAMPRFKGSAALAILIKHKLIRIGFSAIRVMYTGSVDYGFFVNNNGLLELIGADNPEPQDPEIALSESAHPDGWEPEGLDWEPIDNTLRQD